MPPCIPEDLRQYILSSIEAKSLVLLCGAGLSMSPPSGLPAAWWVSRSCADKYREHTGVDLGQTVAENLELLANYFDDQNQLQQILLGILVDWPTFLRRTPNRGHYAVADFLAAQTVELAISTNYDILIETAMTLLGHKDPYPILTENDLNRACRSGSPLLKLHGCADRLRMETIWTDRQLKTQPLKRRIEQHKQWLGGVLPNRDLLVIGFWSDWAYLNSVLRKSLGAAEPRAVILVDPDSDANLATKSPILWEWANKSKTFRHVQCSADDFFGELHLIVSQRLLTRVWEKAAKHCQSVLGIAPPPNIDTLVTSTDTAFFYSLRRDLAGVPCDSACTQIDVNDSKYLKTAIFQIALLAKGAKRDGIVFRLGSECYRLVNGLGAPLSQHATRFSQEPPSGFVPGKSIAVGALDDGGAPANLIRPGSAANIVRSATSWETDHVLEGILRGTNA
jgi:SIR2-like domain